MRPLPIVAGSLGRFRWTLCSDCQEVLFSDSGVRVPPEPELSPILLRPSPYGPLSAS